MIMTVPKPNEIVFLEDAGRCLSEAKTLDEIKTIRDKAAAIRTFRSSCERSHTESPA